LAHAGFFSPDVLKIYTKIESPLEGHPAMYRIFNENGQQKEHGTKGVDFSTGSLGHGLSLGAGMALHSRIYGLDYNVFVITGDGELQEGMVWEALLTIPNKGLTNFMAVIDYNRLQSDDRVDEINQLGTIGG
jgi:transketolase